MTRYQRAKMLKKVESSTGLRTTQKTLLYTLIHNANYGQATMTVDQLATAAGCCIRTAQMNIKFLVDQGYISVEGSGGRGKPNHYQIDLH